MTRKPDAGMLLEIHLKELGVQYEREFHFHHLRRWKADFALTGGMQSDGSIVLIEIEGAVWANGRHTRGSGYTKDLEKYRTASALGYKLFRFSTQEVLDGTAKAFIKEWLL